MVIKSEGHNVIMCVCVCVFDDSKAKINLRIKNFNEGEAI